jgi:hypothetical protein
MKLPSLLLATAFGLALSPALGCTTDDIVVEGLHIGTPPGPTDGAIEIQTKVFLEDDETLRIRVNGQFLVYDSPHGLDYYKVAATRDGDNTQGIIGLAVETGACVVEFVDDDDEVRYATEPFAVWPMGDDYNAHMSSVFLWGSFDALDGFATGRTPDADDTTREYLVHNTLDQAVPLTHCIDTPGAVVCDPVQTIAPGAAITGTLPLDGSIWPRVALPDGDLKDVCRNDLNVQMPAAVVIEVDGNVLTLGF